MNKPIQEMSLLKEQKSNCPLRNVLVFTAGDPERFKELGSSGETSPRALLCYPFYGALQEVGVEVTVRSCGKAAQERTRSGATGWQSSQLRLLSAVRDVSKFDVVVTWGTQGPWFALLNAIINRQNRRILTLSWANYSRGHRLLMRWLRQALYARGLRLCGAAMFVTRRQVNEAVHDLKCDPRRICHLPAGVDAKFFEPWPAYADQGVRPELRALEAQRYVVVAGDQLRDEAQIVPVIENLGIGLVRLTQVDSTELFWKRWAQYNHGRFPVVCIAHLEWREVRYVYQRALCLLNLVDSSWQPAGLTVMTEAMACGLPVIATSGLTTEEMKSHLSKEETLPFIEVEALNPADAREALKRLLDSRQAVEELGHLARRFVEKHLNIRQASEVAVQTLSGLSEDRGRLD